jgi:hypothetical protein
MPSIAELLIAQGQQAAETRRRLGEISGQMWSNLGNTIAQVPGQIQQGQANARRAELENMQLADARARQAGEAVLNHAMQPYQPNGPQEEGAPPAQAQHPYVTENHRWDLPALSDLIASRGLASHAPDLLSSAEKMNAAFDAHDAAQQKLADANTILWGRLAGGYQAAKKAGVPDEQAFDLIVKPAVSGGKLSQQQADQMKTQLMALPPEQRDAQIDGMIDAGDRVGPQETLAKDAKRIGQSGRVLASNVVGEPPKAEATVVYKDDKGVEHPVTFQNGKYLFNGLDVTAQVTKPTTATTLPASQTVDARVKMPGGGTKDIKIERLPGRTAEDPGRFFLPLPNGTKRELFSGVDFELVPSAPIQIMQAGQTAVANIPPWALTPDRPTPAEGNVFEPKIGTTPNGLFQDAQTWLQTGKYPPLGLGQNPLAVARRSAIDSKVGAIAAASGMDVPALQALYRTNAQTLTQQQKAYDIASVAIAKADKDVDLLDTILPKIGDTGIPIFNQPLRDFEKSVAGNPDLSEFATRLKSVQSEYTRIINASPTGTGGGVMTDSAQNDVKQLLDPKATVPQILRSIAALKSEGANRLLSQGEQIQRIQARMQGNTNETAHAVGDIVMVNGQKVKVTQVLPDGKYKGEVVKP